jgi:hypothetical protein
MVPAIWRLKAAFSWAIDLDGTARLAAWWVHERFPRHLQHLRDY